MGFCPNLGGDRELETPNQPSNTTTKHNNNVNKQAKANKIKTLCAYCFLLTKKLTWQIMDYSKNMVDYGLLSYPNKP